MQYGKLPRDVMQAPVSMGAKVLYGALAMYRNGRTLQCNPSQAQLAETIGVSVTHVNNLARELDRSGLIRRTVVPGHQTCYLLPHLSEVHDGTTTPAPLRSTPQGELSPPTQPPLSTPLNHTSVGYSKMLERSPIKVSEQTIEQTNKQTPWARGFVESWNEAFPKTLNHRTNQLADEAAVQRAVEMEGKSLGELQRIRDWLKSSGRFAAYQRPQRWFQLTSNSIRVIDQIELEMEAAQVQQRKGKMPAYVSPEGDAIDKLFARFDEEERQQRSARP